MNDELINNVISLKIMMSSYATGGGGDDNDYIELRRSLLQTEKVLKLLPQCVKICRTLSEFWGFIKPKFSTYADRREYLRAEFDPLLSMLETESRMPGDATSTAVITSVDSDNVREAWNKALERRSSDPEAAITSARTLVEAVCKHVLDSLSVEYDDAVDLPKLYSLAAKQLNLSPSQHTEQLFKQILGGCQTVVEGLGSMRNRHGDAHAKGKASVKPSSRHAELAVNLAGSMATFLLQTLDAKSMKTVQS